MNGAFLGIAAGGLGWILFDLTESRFGGVSARRWRLLQLGCGVLVLALTAWLWWRGRSTRGGLFALTLVSALTLGAGIVRLRAVGASRPGQRLGWGATGIGGLASLGGAVAGMVIGQRWSWELGGVIAALGLGAFVWLIVVDLGRSSRALAAVRARLHAPRPWPKVPDPDAEGFDPWADDRVTGSWDGVPVGVAMTARGARVELDLPRWPRELEARAGASDATGDPRFDAEVALTGPWPGVLDARARTALALVLGAGGRIEPDRRLLVVELGDHELEELVARIEPAVALARALDEAWARAATLEERVLAGLADEPVAAVRLGHLAWLHAAGWELARVLAAAAADPDDAVRAWARANALPASGAYR